jgi:hypothetical protein
MFYEYYTMNFYPESFAYTVESLNDLTSVSEFYNMNDFKIRILHVGLQF